LEAKGKDSVKGGEEKTDPVSGPEENQMRERGGIGNPNRHSFRTRERGGEAVIAYLREE